MPFALCRTWPATALLLTACVTTPPAPTAPVAETTLTGRYLYLADAAVFSECGSQRQLPVAASAAQTALQQAYLAARGEPGKPALVQVRGQVEERQTEAGGRKLPTLVVNSFSGLDAGADCPVEAAALENTYWQLTSLHGQPVATGERGREAHLLLQPEQQRVSGSGGCNRLIGGYSLQGGELRFSRMAGTLMMCPQGMAEEQALLTLLPQTTRWEVVGRQLSLRDSGGTELAAFTARD